MRRLARSLHRQVGVVAAIAALAGCVPDFGYKFPEPRPRPSAKRSAAPVDVAASAAPSAPPSAAPSSTPRAAVVVDAARQEALLAALRAAFPAGRASRVASLLGDASGVLRGNAASIISNNGGAIISDNGGGLISDNGGGLVSDQGGSYRLAQSEVPPGTRPTGLLTYFTARTADLIYEVMASTETRGRFRAFALDQWDALPPERRLEALVDEFSWNDVIRENPYEGDPMRLAMTYKLRKERSKRLPYTDRMESTEIFQMAQKPDGELDARSVGWKLRYPIEVPGADGAPESLWFEAIAGEADLERVQDSNGFEVTLPRKVKLAGTGAAGTYTGASGGTLEIATTITNEGPAGRTTLEMLTRKDGTRRHAVTAEAAKLRLVAELAADGSGTGRLEDLEGAAAGTVAWDAAGLGTLSFEGGGTAQTPLF